MTRSAPAITLIHSPLVGALTWSRVREELAPLGLRVAVPVLDAVEPADSPIWRYQAQTVADKLVQAGLGSPIVLVGHSGAGPLLPAIGAHGGLDIAAYLFVDASLPKDGASRLELIAAESEFADDFQRLLQSGGRFPGWTDDELRPLIPDDGLRRTLLAELQPRGLRFFEEPIAVPAGWPDGPCGYLHFSPAYDRPLARAQEMGWVTRHLDGSHFHMLVNPAAVAVMILELIEELLA
jgi:hypothetical protein